jgi:two-component system, NarL family, sensor kinase
MHDVRRHPGLATRVLAGPRTGPLMGLGCVAVTVAGLVLALGPGGRSPDGLLHDNVVTNAVNGVTLGVLGAVLTRLRPANRVGWLVLATAWCNGLAILGEGWALASYRFDLPGRTLAVWLGSWPWVLGLVLGPTLLPLLYPTGRTHSRFAHRLAVAVTVALLVVAGSIALLDDAYQGVLPGRALGANPLSHGHLQGALGLAAGGGAVTVVLLGLVAWGHTVRRLWRAASPEREQLGWLLAMGVPLLVVAPLNQPWLTFAIQVVSPVGLLIGIVRHDLFDIKFVLRSGLLYAALSLIAVGAYFGLVGLITRITPPGTVPTLFAVAAVALVVVPLRGWLQRGVVRLVYGDRADPVRALARIARGMRGAADDAAGLGPMLAGIAEALRSPYVAVAAPDGEPLAAVGTPHVRHRLHEVELRHAGDLVGHLQVAPRTARDRFAALDRRLLDALAGPVAAAVRASLMTREVAASRARVLAVREAERSRLRADLHDGLGPSLSGVALGLEAAEASLSDRPERVAEMLPVLRREVDNLVTEVRAIIGDLGPTELDLVAALRGQVESASASGRLVELHHSGPVDQLPGDVAVAAQRIAGEALSNAVRHAGATRINVCVSSESDVLTVEVADDGCGTVTTRDGGIGLESMRRRAEALGGLLTVSAAPGHGTRVVARLPMAVT